MAIKRLPDDLIERIAAGEVITSPYGIIKELLENSLDAGASTVTVNLDSALQHISIRDNGHGVAKEDLEYLCMNHYTSKTESVADLMKQGSIASGSSFGFRGEALHSMSLCGHIKVQTRTACDEDGVGHMATYRNGRLTELKKCAFDGCGAFVEIRDIFYNSPIRAEHYRRNKGELMSCIGLVAQYGIIHSGIECRTDGKVVLGKETSTRKIDWDTLSCTDTIERRKEYIMTHILNEKGISAPGSLRSLTKRFEDETSSRDGLQAIFTEPNTCLKSTYFVLFVNKRLVRNDTLRNKIVQKYRAIRKACNPFVFVELLVEDLDVNVHPSKTEVLIGRESVFHDILRAFDTAFSDNVEISATPAAASTSPDSTTMQSSIPVLGDTLADAHSSIPSMPILMNKTPSSSPLKIYSSPFVRRLNELEVRREQPQRKFSLISLRTLLGELKDVDPLFLRSLVFVGTFEDSIYAQHQSNLLKLNKIAFLFNAFYQKILREFGNFESVDLKLSVETTVDSSLWKLLREYLGVHIENGKIIALPRIYEISPETSCCNAAGEIVDVAGCFNDFTVEKTDEISTIRSMAIGIARIYSKVEVTSTLFNMMKSETTATREVVETLSLLTGLRDMYKTFDRC